MRPESYCKCCVRERERERQGFMYRYLHGCKVAKSCGMLQVADPRAAAEELVNPARPLHSRPEWFNHLKRENKPRAKDWGWKIQFILKDFFLLVTKILIIQGGLIWIWSSNLTTFISNFHVLVSLHHATLLLMLAQRNLCCGVSVWNRCPFDFRELKQPSEPFCAPAVASCQITVHSWVSLVLSRRLRSWRSMLVRRGQRRTLLYCLQYSGDKRRGLCSCGELIVQEDSGALRGQAHT